MLHDVDMGAMTWLASMPGSKIVVIVQLEVELKSSVGPAGEQERGLSPLLVGEWTAQRTLPHWIWPKATD